MSIRDERIKKSLEKEIMNLIVSGGVKDPRIPTLLTITKITLSKDKHYSHIYITLNGSEEEKKLAVLGLNNARGFFQQNIASKLQLRYTPKIEFRLDKFEEQADRVDELLKNISEEMNSGNNDKDE